MTDPVLSSVLAPVLAQRPLRAGGFIVTVFGDAVLPRGAQVWMASVLDLCGLVGISQTLVRTAMSRLVAAGHVQGQRVGRRSAYALTDAACAESQAASALIYGPTPPWQWRFVHLPDDAEGPVAAQLLETAGYARVRPGLMVGPARAALPVGAVGFSGQAAGDPAALCDFARQHWDLDAQRAGYDAFIRCFDPVLAAGLPDDPHCCLALRLLLVDAWRHIRLRDPGLPLAALPKDWPRLRAQRMFLDLYDGLCTPADSALSALLEGPVARFRPGSAESKARQTLLARARKALTDNENAESLG